MSRYSIKRIQTLLHELDNASTSDEKGAKLEALAKYLFEKIPGVEYYKSNILDSNRAHEIDVAFTNPQNKSPLCFLDFAIIVECKNTANPIGSSDVGWFVRKLQDRGANHGILISLQGITGDRDGHSSAHSEVLSALVRDKIKILIIAREEILKLANTNDLVSILREKYMKLSLEKTII